jgi:hypothetical protein
MAIGGQYLCSLNARGRTTMEGWHVARHPVQGVGGGLTVTRVK